MSQISQQMNKRAKIALNLITKKYVILSFIVGCIILLAVFIIATTPLISIKFPTNTTYLGNVTDFNYTADSNADYCWYSTDLGDTNYSITCGSNVTGLNATQGSNTWTLWANDTSNNINSTLVTFVTSSIQIVSPYNESYDVSNLNFNITLIGLTGSWCGYGYDGTPNVTMSTGDNISYGKKKSLISGGGHNVLFTCNDTTGNWFTKSISFTRENYFVQVTSPAVISPLQTNYSSPLSFNVSTDYLSYFDSGEWCGYSLDGAANVTMNTTDNINFTAPNVVIPKGSHELYVYCNSSNSSIYSSHQYFYIGAIPKEDCLQAVANQSYSGDGNCSINYNGTYSFPLPNDHWSNPKYYNYDASTATENWAEEGYNVTEEITFYAPFNKTYDSTWRAYYTGVVVAFGGEGGPYPGAKYYSLSLLNTTSSYSCINNNIVNLRVISSTETCGIFDCPRQYYYCKDYKGQWKSLGNSTVNGVIIENMLLWKAGIADTTPPNITINSPISKYYTESNQSINISVVDYSSEISSCWFNVVNSSSGTTIIENTTIADCNLSSFNITTGYGLYNLTVYSNDTVNNLGFSTVSLGYTQLAVILENPLSTSWNITSSFINFSFYANSTQTLSTCQLWGNWTGVWHKNYTWNSPGANLKNSTIVNITDGNYKYNLWCNDSDNIENWGLNNKSFGVDLYYPTLNITVIATITGSQTIRFYNLVSDINLASCKYTILNSTGGIDGLNNNVSFSCNAPIAATVTDYDTYNLTIYALDLAGHENSSTKTFLTAEIVIGGGGGGGGSLAEKLVLVPSNRTYIGDGICQNPQNGFPNGNDDGVVEDFYNAPNDCPGFNIDSTIFNCFDKDSSTACIWDQGLAKYVGLFMGIIIALLMFTTVEEPKTKKQVAIYNYALNKFRRRR